MGNKSRSRIKKLKNRGGERLREWRISQEFNLAHNHKRTIENFSTDINLAVAADTISNDKTFPALSRMLGAVDNQYKECYNTGAQIKYEGWDVAALCEIKLEALEESALALERSDHEDREYVLPLNSVTKDSRTSPTNYNSLNGVAPKKEKKARRRKILLEDPLAPDDSDFVTCCALACTNTSQTHVMFQLPQDPQVRQVWVKNIDRTDWTPSDDSSLCQIHFEADSWDGSEGGAVLKQGVLPTLCLHGEAINSWVTMDNDGNVNNVLVRNRCAGDASQMEIDSIETMDETTFIKQEIMDSQIDEEGEGMSEDGSGVSRPFESVYFESKPNVDNLIITPSHVKVTSLSSGVEPETIVPELIPITIKKEMDAENLRIDAGKNCEVLLSVGSDCEGPTSIESGERCKRKSADSSNVYEEPITFDPSLVMTAPHRLHPNSFRPRIKWRCPESCKFLFSNKLQMEQHVKLQHPDSESAMEIIQTRREEWIKKNNGKESGAKGKVVLNQPTPPSTKVSIATCSKQVSIVTSSTKDSLTTTTPKVTLATSSTKVSSPSVVTPQTTTTTSASSAVVARGTPPPVGSTLIAAPISGQGDNPGGPKKFLLLIPQQTGAVRVPAAQPSQTVPTTQSCPEPSATPAIDDSEFFSLSLAQFPKESRISIKQKLMELVEALGNRKLDPDSVIIACRCK